MVGDRQEKRGTDGIRSRPRGARASRLRERVADTTRLVGLTEYDLAYFDIGREYAADVVRLVATQPGTSGDPEPVAELAEAAAEVRDIWPGTNAETVERCMWVCFERPFTPSMTDELAAVAHDPVRPRVPGQPPLKAHYLTAAIARCFAGFVEELGAAIDDPNELARCAAAWSKRLAIELDVVLAVYAAAARTPNWY